jgi:dolichol-phosphate mannosyltransferase
MVETRTAVQDVKHPLLISVVVPCFNEADVLPRTYERLSKALSALHGFRYELLFVDDGSSDATWGILADTARHEPAVRAIRLSRNFGHQAACMAGLRAAEGDAVVLIDADLQDPPELIEDMAGKWLDGWSVVSATRRRRSGETLFKKSSAFVFYRLFNLVSDQPLALDSGDFRLLGRDVVDLLTQMREKDLFLRGTVSWFGLPETTVEYDRDPRLAGASKYTLSRMLSLSRRGLVANSAAPLRLPTYLGAAAIVVGTGVALLRRDPRPAVAAAAFGAQALAIGVLGEYLHAVFRQVQGRPDYVVAARLEPVPHPAPEPKGAAA